MLPSSSPISVPSFVQPLTHRHTHALQNMTTILNVLPESTAPTSCPCISIVNAPSTAQSKGSALIDNDMIIDIKKPESNRDSKLESNLQFVRLVQQFQRRQLKRKRHISDPEDSSSNASQPIAKRVPSCASISVTSVTPSPAADTPTDATSIGTVTAQCHVTTDDGMQRYFCSRCQQVCPASAFFPSYIERRVYTCRMCSKLSIAATRMSRRLSEAQPDLTIDAYASRDRQHDVAFHMVERFRRRCANEILLPHWHGHAGVTQRRGLRLRFGAKIARMLLKFWNNTSALQMQDLVGQSWTDGSNPSRMAGDWSLCTAEPEAVMDATNRLQSNTDHGAKLKATHSERSASPLMFVLWSKTDVWAVEPWECIPVTRAEAATFRKVPINLRAELLPLTKAAEINTRLHDLYLLCTSQKSQR